MSKAGKFLGIVSVAIAAAWIFTSCWGNKAKDKHTDTATSGVIQISADESFRDIVQQEIDVFESIYVQAGIMPIYASEVDAINLLLKDSVRLAVASRQLTEAEKEGLAQKKLFPKEIKIATDGIALIVNKQNADSMISIPDLREILTGRITRWNQLNPGSKLGDLQLVFDNQNSSTVRFAIDSICRGDSLAGNLSAQHDNAAVIDYVSKTPGAIGVIGVTWVGNKSDSTRMTFSELVTVMSVSRESDARKQLQAFSGLYRIGTVSAGSEYVRTADRSAQRVGVGIRHVHGVRSRPADHSPFRHRTCDAKCADRKCTRKFVIKNSLTN